MRSVRIVKKRAKKSKNPYARNMLMVRGNYGVSINLVMLVTQMRMNALS